MDKRQQTYTQMPPTKQRRIAPQAVVPPLVFRGAELHIVMDGAKEQDDHYDDSDAGKNYLTVAYEATHANDFRATTAFAAVSTQSGWVETNQDGSWDAWYGDTLHHGQANNSERTRVALFFVFSTTSDHNQTAHQTERQLPNDTLYQLETALAESGFKEEIMKVAQKATRYTTERGEGRTAILLPPALCKKLMLTLLPMATRKKDQFGLIGMALS